MSLVELKVPDIGVVEASVTFLGIKKGDFVNFDDILATLETDKAAIDIPVESIGRVEYVYVDIGNKVSKGDIIAVIEVDSELLYSRNHHEFLSNTTARKKYSSFKQYYLDEVERKLDDIYFSQKSIKGRIYAHQQKVKAEEERKRILRREAEEAAKKEWQRILEEKIRKEAAEAEEKERKRIQEEKIRKEKEEAEAAEKERIRQERIAEQRRLERERIRAEKKRILDEKREREILRKKKINLMVSIIAFPFRFWKFCILPVLALLCFMFFYEDIDDSYIQDESYEPQLINNVGTEEYQFNNIDTSKLEKIQEGGYWGLADDTGRFVLPPEFLFVGYVFEGFSAVQERNSKWGFVNINNPSRNIIAQFDCVSRFSEGLAGVNLGGIFDNNSCKGGKWGAIDSSGEIVIPIMYDMLEPFKENRSRVTKGRNIGYIDRSNDWVDFVNIDPSSGDYSFYQGLAKYTFGGQYGFIDKTGRVVIPAKYSYAGIFSEGLAAVRNSNGLWGFIDKDGNVAIDFRYSCSSRFKEGVVGVNINGSWEYKDGKFSCVGGLWGFVNSNGDWVIQPIFESVDLFKNGYADVIYFGNNVSVDLEGNIYSK